MIATAVLDPLAATSTQRVVDVVAAGPGPELALACERLRDHDAVEALVAQAFGPGRFAKAAERVRETARFRPDLSLCAWRDATLAGTVRLWSVRVGARPALFLGPIAVSSHLRGRGIAARLVERACEAASEAGERSVVLVGDLPRFGPMGFGPVPSGRISAPGPVDPSRLLWRGLDAGALDGLEGALLGPGDRRERGAGA